MTFSGARISALYVRTMMSGEVEFVYVRTVGVTPGLGAFYVYAVLLECIKIIEWSMYRITAAVVYVDDDEEEEGFSTQIIHRGSKYGRHYTLTRFRVSALYSEINPLEQIYYLYMYNKSHARFSYHILSLSLSLLH